MGHTVTVDTPFYPAIVLEHIGIRITQIHIILSLLFKVVLCCFSVLILSVYIFLWRSIKQNVTTTTRPALPPLLYLSGGRAIHDLP